MKKYRLVLCIFNTCSLMFFAVLFLTATLHAGGAYRVEVKKDAGEEPEVTIKAVGKQAKQEEGKLEKTSLQDPDEEQAETTTTTICPDEEGALDAGTAEAEDDETSFASELASAVVQLFAMLGDAGLAVGYEYWNAPMPTRFAYNDEQFWNDHAGIGLWKFSLLFNMPIAPVLELEPKLGFGFGRAVREVYQAGGYAKETMTMNTVRYGVDLLYTFSSPFFMEAGVFGNNITTSIELETDLPNFEYTGFLLDDALATEVTLGAGIISPQDWFVRLRAGIQGYYHFADFGNSKGIRVYGVILFPTQQSPAVLAGD